MEWVTSVIVPILIGMISSIGTVGLTKKLDGRRDIRQRDLEARLAIEAYVREIDDYSDLLQAQADSHGDWHGGAAHDETKNLINKGSTTGIKSAFETARPYFHRLQLASGEEKLISNRFPDFGDHRVEGALNFHARAREIETALTRGLKPERS